MKATCPGCAAQYTIDDAKVAGRVATIRCPKCQTVITIDGTTIRASRQTQPMGAVGPTGAATTGQQPVAAPTSAPPVDPPRPSVQRPAVATEPKPDPLGATLAVPPPPRPQTPDPLGATMAVPPPRPPPDPLGATMAVPAPRAPTMPPPSIAAKRSQPPAPPAKKARTAKPGLPQYRPRNVVVATSRDASLPFVPRVALAPSKVDFEVPIEFNFEGHYDILGVSRNASAEEIKKAAFDMFGIYDRRARKGGDETATQRLQKVNEAQDVLGKPDKRTKYDREPESIFLTIQDPHPYERIAWNEGLDLIREVLMHGAVRDPLRELEARIDDADRPNAILDQLLR